MTPKTSSKLRKATSIKIDPEIWKLAKKQAIDKDMQVSEYVEKLITDDIKKKK